MLGGLAIPLTRHLAPLADGGLVALQQLAGGLQAERTSRC
jgi:hypothetical protein